MRRRRGGRAPTDAGPTPQLNPAAIAPTPRANAHAQPLARSLAVVLPSFNEAENIPLMIEKGLTVLPELAESWEIVVVDDGSADGTSAAAQPYVDEHYPRVRLLRHTTTQGYGAAIRYDPRDESELTPFAHAPKGRQRRRPPRRPT